MGPSFSRRFGVEKSRGEIIAQMDADDVSLPERFQKQVAFFDANPDISAVGAYANEADGNLRNLRTIQPPLHHASILISHYFGLPFVDATLMFRRSLLKDCEYPHVLFPHLIVLLGRARYANIPEALYVYRRHLDSVSFVERVNRPLRRICELEQHRGELMDVLLATFEKLYWRKSLSWRERRSARRGFTRLVDAMIAAQWVEPGDRPLMIAEVNRRLEQTSPRLWQMFCHWRRSETEDHSQRVLAWPAAVNQFRRKGPQRR